MRHTILKNNHTTGCIITVLAGAVGERKGTMRGYEKELAQPGEIRKDFSKKGPLELGSEG